jgi:Cytochrome c oxidase subunit IIa family
MKSAAPRPTAEHTEHEGYHAPQGTLAVLAVYLALIIAGWAAVYLVMLSRGGVQ